MRRQQLGLSFLITVALAVFASAQANVRITPGERSNRNAEYRQAAANYCRLDYDGARILPDGWARIQPFTTWRENPDYKRIAVVTRYQILPDMVSEHGRYTFNVQYDISGEYDLSGGYFPDPMRIVVQVEVGEPADQVRVVGTSESRPFVGRPRFQQWLQAKLNAETDPVAKATLQASLQRLLAQPKNPPTD
jgi:hypothetical protein